MSDQDRLPPLPPDWEATFENTKEDRRRIFASLTPGERLEWLQGAIELAYATGAFHRRMARKWSMSVEDVKRILP